MTGTANKWRIGNLLLFTPGDGQTGMAIFDVGDPRNIKLLDNYTGNLKQYSTAFQIWRNTVVLMTGSNDNGPSGTANAVAEAGPGWSLPPGAGSSQKHNAKTFFSLTVRIQCTNPFSSPKPAPSGCHACTRTNGPLPGFCSC